MKKIVAVLTVGLMMSSMGCATLGTPLTVPDEPVAKTEAPRPTKMPPARTNVDPEEINDENYSRQAGELEKEMKRERRYLAPQEDKRDE